VDMQLNNQIVNVKPSLKARIIQRVKKLDRLMVITVIIPTLISILYFGLIASDVYVSEARFVVRAPQKQASVSGLGSLLQNAGFSSSHEDSYTVQDFMKSRDAVEGINKQLPLREAFGAKNADFFSRFNSFGLNDSSEDLYKYYQNKIEINLDATSSISTMTIHAFTPEDAYRINEMLLQMGENLVNQLNTRGRQDMIGFATSEVKLAEQKAKEAALALSSYRNKNSVFDPERQSALQLQQITKLQEALITTNAQLAQIESSSPQNPQIPALRLHVKVLQKEMDEQMSKVAGGDKSLTNKAAEYERLALERGFADRQLAAALASLENARNEAQRKQLYLERIVQPNQPDTALEPKRLKGIAATFLLGLILWGILTILIAGVREHRD
jgi:capsular polysaccharide transport system permease protein